MTITTPIASLPTNSQGERQLETHQMDDNFAALETALSTGFSAIFASGGTSIPGLVTLTGTALRVQGRVGLTLDGINAVSIQDQTLQLFTLTAGKKLLVITADPVTVGRPYTDVVTGQTLTDVMRLRLGQLVVIGAGDAGVTLDAQGYPLPPSATLPVARLTRTSGGVNLDGTIDAPPTLLSGGVTSADLNTTYTALVTLLNAGLSDLDTRVDNLEAGGGGPGVSPTVGESSNRLTSPGIQVYTGAGDPQLEIKTTGRTFILTGLMVLGASLTRGTPNPYRTSTFSTFSGGAVSGQQGWTGSGTITGGMLEATQQFNAGYGAVAPGTFAEGEIIAEIDPGKPYPLIRLNYDGTRAYAAWMHKPSGTSYDLGVITGTSGVASASTTTPYNLSGVPVMLRVIVERKRLAMWVWNKGSVMPNAPMATYALSNAQLTGDGQTTVTYTDATGGARLNALSIRDGNSRPGTLDVQARWTGRWWTAYREGIEGLATITQGSEFAARVGGGTLTAQVYRDPDTTQTPRFAVSVEGGAYSLVYGPTTSGWSTVTLATGLDGDATVKVVVDGLHESDAVWDAAALVIGALESPGSSVDATVPLTTPTNYAVLVGDSITAGVLARGNAGGSLPVNSAGSRNYARLAAEGAGLLPVQAAYGGVGVAAATTGSGSVPGALGNIARYHARHLETPPYAAATKIVLVNLGTNDASQGVAAATFQSDYQTLLITLHTRFPNAKVLALRPFGGQYASNIQAAVTAAGSWAQYVDTTGWVSTYTDGVHPNLAGHAAAAGQLQPIITAAIP